MRIAMLQPVADRPARRAYALWAAAARDLADALAARGAEVARVDVPDPAPGEPSYAQGIRGVDSTLRVAHMFRHASDYDIIHDLVGFATMYHASFVDTPVLSTVWMDMWECAGPAYHDLNQRVFYVAPGDRERSTRLHYSGTIPWALDPQHIPLCSECGDGLAFAGPMTAAGGAREALELSARAGLPLTLVGAPSDPAFFEDQLAPHVDGAKVQWLQDPASPQAVGAVAQARALVHVGGFDGMQQLTLMDAAMRGTPILAMGASDPPSWFREGKTGLLARNADEARGAVGRLHDWPRSECRRVVENDRPFAPFVDQVFALYERLIAQQRRMERRPWGHYEVLSDEPDHKVKRIVVYAGKRLSLQRHRHRDEHWYLVSGEALVVQDEEEIRLLPGQSICIPKGCWHRIRNPGAQNLTMIEVQTGSYFGEDDIDRKEDDFGRA